MNNKKFSVKAYTLEKQLNSPLQGKYGNIDIYKTKITLLARDLTWGQAKKIRNENRALKAGIFPNCPEPELKIIKLN